MMETNGKMANKVNDDSALAIAMEVLKTDKLLHAVEKELHRLARRLWSHVDKEHRPQPTSCVGYGPCLLWTAGTNKGYAVMWVRGKMKRASHVAWFLATLEWPKYLCHACDNPLCVAIDHLIHGDPAFNAYDRVVKKLGGILINRS